MAIQFKELEVNPREHLKNRPHNNRVGLSDHAIYLRKQNSRKKRANEITKNEIKQKFFDWIEEIQDKLKLTNDEFAIRISANGGRASCQTVKLWKRRVGHYPNDANFKALKRLEKEAKIEVVDIKFLVRLVCK